MLSIFCHNCGKDVKDITEDHFYCERCGTKLRRSLSWRISQYIIRYFKKMNNDSLIKNSVYLMMTNVFGLSIGFFFWMVAARYYTPHDIGTVSVLLSAIFLISMICSIGFPTALIYFLPRDPKNANKMINSCMITSITASFILSLICVLRIDIWAPELNSFINILSIDGIIFMTIFIIMATTVTISNIIGGTFVAGRKSSYHMVKETTLDLVKILPVILLSGLGVMGILLSWTIGLMLALAIGFILLHRLWGYSPVFTVDPIIKSMLSLSAGNYIAGIVSYVPRSLLPIIIMNTISVEESGYFFIAMTVASLLMGVPQSIANSLFAESYKKDRLWDNVGKAIRFDICIIFPGLLLFMIFGKFVLNLFNPSYAEHASTTLVILAMASIPLSVNNTFNSVRNSQKRVMSVIENNMLVAGITIPLSIYLVESGGIEGVAMAYLIANTIVAMTVVYRTKNPVEFALRLLKSDNKQYQDT